MKDRIQDNTSLLNLSKNELIILNLLDKYNTPISLAKNCAIPRPTIYITLEKLVKRGLIKSHKRTNKKCWLKTTNENIERLFRNAESLIITRNSKTAQRISLTNNLQISVHKGAKQIFDLLTGLTKRYSQERMVVIQGELIGDSWNRVLGLSKINLLNKQIKEVGMITELITSKKWFEHQTNFFGPKWAKDFEGRATRVQNIDDKYLDYGSQIFIIKNHVFLVSMEDEIFIEIINKEIAGLIISLSKFIQDHSEVFDPNTFLREFIQKAKE